MPSPEKSTSQVSDKLGLELVCHTLNTGDLVLNISCNTALRGWAGGGGVLHANILGVIICPKMS